MLMGFLVCVCCLGGGGGGVYMTQKLFVVGFI